VATIVTRAGKGAALTHQEVDANFTGLNTELGQKEVASNKGVANGYASLDAAGKVPSAQLPSYVDDVVEVANFASLPSTGETGKIYVTIDANKTYRWTGSTYIEISASPGSTDSLAEGSTNLYFTQARARASISASGSLSYNSSTGVMSFSDAVTSVAGRTGAVTLTSSDVGLGNVENKSSATIRGEITSSNVTTALGYTPYNSSNPSGYITSSALSSYLPLSGGTLSGALNAPNFADSSGSYNVNLGSGNIEGRGAVAGFSGGAYGGIGYNLRHTGTSEAYIAPGADTVSYLRFDSGGFRFFRAAAGAAGRSITFTGSGNAFLDGSGNWYTAGQMYATGSQHLVLNTGNVGSYALPITGGTLTGDLQISSNWGGVGYNEALTIYGTYPSMTFRSTTSDTGWLVHTQSDGGLTYYSIAGASTNNWTQRMTLLTNGELRRGGASGDLYIHSGNYSSYSPTLTGSGASGTWGISISGSAETLDGLDSSRFIRRVRNRIHADDGTSMDQLDGSVEHGFNYGTSSGVQGPYITFGGLFGEGNYQGQINASYQDSSVWRVRTRNNDTGVWNAWRTLLNESNYSSYALPLSGGTVEGTANVRTSVIKQYHYVRHIEGKNWDTYDTSASGLYLNYASNQPVYIGSASNVALHAGNYGSYALPLSGGALNGATINGQTHYQWEGATYRNPGDWTATLIARRDNSSTGINGHIPALVIYNNHGGDQTTAGISFATAEGATGAGNSVALAGIVAKKESSGNVGGWSAGSLNFYVKNFGSRVDAMTIGNGGSVNILNSLTLPNSTTAVTLASGYYIGMGDWGLRNTTPYGWIQFGPANSSWCHIYGSQAFYFNQELYVNNQQVLHGGNYTSYAPSLGGSGASGTWNISISGTSANSSAVNGRSVHQIFNNMGQNHSAYTDFNSVPDFGAYYVQGTGNGPGTGAGQFYGFTLGLGNEYAHSSYACQIAIPRYAYNGSGDRYLSIRNREGGTWGGWSKINAGYADSAGGSTTTSQRSFSGDISASGQGRFTGWYNGNAATGQAAEIGMSGGQGYIFVYNRDTSSYGTLNIASSGANLQFSGGAVNLTAGSLQHGGNQVIHAGNYTSYSPSLGGSGASGTWGISITGNSDTVDGVHASSFTRKDITGQWIKPYYEYGSYLTSESPSTMASQMSSGGGLRVDFMHPSYTGSGNWNHVITFSGYNFYNMYQLGAHYDGGTGTDLWVRSEANHGGSSWTAWRKLLNSSNYNSYSPTLTGGGASGTWGINISGSAAQLNGYSSAENGASVILRTASNGYLYLNNWINVAGSGLFSTTTNGSHFYPNNGSYGSWRVAGSRNGWSGIEFDASNTQVSLMCNTDGNTVGWHANSYGWKYRWASGTLYIHKGTYGGGTEAVALDSSNYSNYTFPLGGGWYGSGLPGSRAYGMAISGGEFVIGNGLPNAGQIGVLIDGCYVAGENNGFWSMASDNTWGSRRGMYWDGTYLNFTTNSATTRHSAVYSDGNVTAYSDERVKTNWRGVQENFVFRLAGVKSGIFDRTDIELTQAGVSAQSMREVLPEVVIESNEGTLSVAYGNAAMVSAIELAKELVTLRNKVAALEARIH